MEIINLLNKYIYKNNMSDMQVYIELKAIFSGCDTVNDALLFTTQYCEKYPHMKSTIISYMNSYTFNDNIDIRTKQTKMKHLYLNIHTREDAQEYVAHMTDSLTDDIFWDYVMKRYTKVPKHILRPLAQINIVRTTLIKV